VVQRNQSGFFAYVVGPDDKVRVQPIDVADTIDGKATIAKGLAAGDRVVVDGQYRLTPGARIAETGTGSASPAPGADKAASAAGARP
jgi:multidrug efflux system membrane fusion protein